MGSRGGAPGGVWGEDLGSFGSGGDAFLRINLSQGCPQPGNSGNYCTADIDGSGDCLVGLSDLLNSVK